MKKIIGGNEDGTYDFEVVEDGLKEYYISEEDYSEDSSFDGVLGLKTQPVIAPIKESSGTERFYVMALKDIDEKQNGTYYDWYNAAHGKMNDYSSTTKIDFGSGRENTINMMKKWDAGEEGGYGKHDQCSSEHKDLWGEIKDEYEKGWYVPSKEEWSAFAGELGIKGSNTSGENYTTYGLSNYYWSSSQGSTGSAWCVNFFPGYMRGSDVNGNYYVRLGATF